MLVSIDPWRREVLDGSEVEFLAVQFEHFGFMLSAHQVRELYRKLACLWLGKECPPEPHDSLFVDLDRTTRAVPFFVVALGDDAPRPAWFCDIPEPAARELYRRLTESLATLSAARHATAACDAGPPRPEGSGKSAP